MLRRAKELQSVFNAYCTTHQHPQFKLDKTEWRQIEYLLCITEPFFEYTTELSTTKEVTIHLILGIYNNLFDHLEKSIRQLQRKKVSWKTTMLDALEAAKEKLSAYYKETDHEMHGNIFAVGTIIAPSNKLQFFSTREWDGPWREQYRKCLADYLQRYIKQFPTLPTLLNTQSSSGNFSRIEMLVSNGGPKHGNTSSKERDELEKYLESG
jgi:hypothetical protein